MHLEIYTACKVVTGLMLYVIITTTTEQQHEWHLLKTAVKKEKRPYVCKIILCVYSHYNDGRHKITVCTIYFKKKFVKADYHLPKVVPAEDAFFSIFHSLGQLLSFFHSFFPFYCFFLFVLRLIPTSVFLSHFLSALKLFSLYLKRKKKNTQKTLHMGLFFCLKTRTREEISLDFFFLFMCYLLSAASFSF